MIKFKTQDINLGDQVNRDRIPFIFEGNSSYAKDVTLHLKAACGCTGVPSLIKVEGKSNFKIEGFLKRRKNLGSMKKKISVTIKNEIKKELATKDLYFTVNIVT